jgi:hypothetical protein
MNGALLEDFLQSSPQAAATPKLNGAWLYESSSPNRASSPDETPNANMVMTHWPKDCGSPMAQHPCAELRLPPFPLPMPDGSFQGSVQQLNQQTFSPQMQPQMPLPVMQQPMAMPMDPQQMQQQMGVSAQVMPQTAQLQHPEHLAYAQNVQSCFSPATACSGYLPEQQQMQIPTQPFPPELVRACSSGSDGSSPGNSPYMMNFQAAQQAMQLAGFQQAPDHAHMQACVPAIACGYTPQAQQFLVPMNFAPPMMQMQQPVMQHIDAQPTVLPPVQHDEECTTDAPKCGQTEVSSGSTRGDSGAESTADAVSDCDSSALPQRAPVPQALADALGGISVDPASAGFALEALVRLVGFYPVEDFALALYSAAEPNLVKTIAELVLRLQPMFAAGTQDELLGHRVWKLCEEDLPYIASDCPPERSHGTVMLAAELFMHGVIALAAMKELFAILLFSESHPADHAVSLACHGFLRVGQVMDSSEVGSKMVEYLILRLKEVKGLNLSIATRQSITEVVELRKYGWEPAHMGTSREKTSGQKKARAAARVRARNLIARVQESVAEPWAGFSNDARALTALLELAAARDRGAERTLACAPDEFVDIFRIIATPATLPVVLALRS